MANDGGRSSGTAGRPTSLVDIAPTIADFLGLSTEGFDGSRLPLEVSLAGKST
jgi:arylsulfatase A-like enzyme